MVRAEEDGSEQYLQGRSSELDYWAGGAMGAEGKSSSVATGSVVLPGDTEACDRSRLLLLSGFYLADLLSHCPKGLTELCFH